MLVRGWLVWVSLEASSGESMFTMILRINNCIITDLITSILWLVQLNDSNNSTKHAGRYLPSLPFVFHCKKTRQTFSNMCSQAGHASYLWASVLVPLAACPLWHACDIDLLVAKAETFPFVWLQHPGSTLTTMEEKLSYCTSTARGSSSATGAREGGGRRKGVREESVPLRSSAVTTPAWPGEESAPLTSPRRSDAPRYISSVFT